MFAVAHQAQWQRSHLFTPVRVQAVRHGLTVAGLVVLLLFVLPNEAIDIHTYWRVDPAAPYVPGSAVEGWGAFPYSPVAALLLTPLHALSFEQARLLLIGLDLACLWWLVGPWALACVALWPVFQEISAGNVQLLIVTAIVAGIRWPAAWSFVLLTKVTPGVGLLWFAVRREWRSLATALAATTVLAAASFVLQPSWWPGWITMLRSNVGSQQYLLLFGAPVWMPPLLLRLPLAALLVVRAARTDRRWVLPVACMLALPAVWTSSLAMLVGSGPLLAWTPSGSAEPRRSIAAAVILGQPRQSGSPPEAAA